MSMEEQDLLKSAVIEFAEKNILNNATKIEKEGIPPDLVKSLASQGFLGASISTDLGGSGIDRTGYLVILKELASYSPSVSALILATSSISASLIGDSDPEMVRKLASGDFVPAVSLWPVLEGSGNAGSVKKQGNRLSGVRRFVMGSSDRCLVLDTDDDELVLVKGGYSLEDEEHHLSFRGFGYGKARIDSSDYLSLGSGGGKKIAGILESMDLEVAAVALGIARGAIQKAVEYTKVRKTFDRPLSDYGPVANNLSRLLAEIRMGEYSLKDVETMGPADQLMAKIFAVDLSKRATKFALQYHGGYGYIEDFGIEKYYRDAVGLSVVFQRPRQDAMRLSQHVFGGKSGYL